MLQYAIVGKSIDRYCNNVYFDILLHKFAAFWQHKSVDTGFSMWTILVKNGISFVCWQVHLKIVIFLKKRVLC